MACVTSLGLHKPTGLHYAIQEHLVPSDPSSTSYEWHNHFDGDSSSTFEDDELLVTSRCVIWSRGGIFRKAFKFDLEKEDVTRALLTTFPSLGPLAARENKERQKKGSAAKRETAIVVFLKTQAHVYFLSGTSHVVHLPFEVDTAFAAPNGIIIQRKLRVESPVAASVKFPRVPPNSFVSSQPQPWSAASSQQSTFSIADLGGPKQMPMPQSTLKDMWNPPAVKSDSNWPRLFSLSDPLAEIGLVVAQPSKSFHHKSRSHVGKITALDASEEILHVSRRGEFSPQNSERPLILALTLNRETSMYTVWKFAYVGDEVTTVAEEKRRVVSGTMSRRRSSFMPGAATGATTPVANNQHSFRESLGGSQQGVNFLKGSIEDEARDKIVDFASSLDPDFESTSLPRRKSRRVSSMLARADLSATHERSAFSDTGHHAHSTSRRGDSLGSQHARLSIGPYPGASFSHGSQFNHSLNGHLEAPVDDLLEELRAGGDFEGFHNMGLDDDEFDAFRQEVVLSKVCSVPAEHSNVRYSSQNMPAATQCKIFTLTAPPSANDDKHGDTIVVCLLDPDEKRLLVMTLYSKTHKADADLSNNRVPGVKSDRDVTVVTLASSSWAKGVIDACRVDDGQISRILALTGSADGYGELSLQAPWSTLMKVTLPAQFALSNIRNLSHDPTPRARREGSFERVLSRGPRALRGVRNPKPGGIVDLVDDEGRLHQLQLLLEPRNPHVCKILELCRAVIPGGSGGEGILVFWWNVMQWIRLENIHSVDEEWTALVITIFALVFGLSGTTKATQVLTKKKPRRGHLRSSSGAQLDSENWGLMQAEEASHGNPSPSWASNTGWNWLIEDGEFIPRGSESSASMIMPTGSKELPFIRRHVDLARKFAGTKFGSESMFGSLPTSGNRSIEVRKAALTDIFIALHLLNEEQKLDTMMADSFSTGLSSLAPILAQIARWLRWDSWMQYYEVEEASLLNVDYDTESPIHSPILEPFECPSVYDWIQACLQTRSVRPYITLSELVTTRLPSATHASNTDQWLHLTPRTMLFERLFSAMRTDWTSQQIVEALSSAGANQLMLETLPEAVLAPLQEAIVKSQAEPPATWNKDLLSLIGRQDVGMLLTPGQRPPQVQSTLLAPTHEANLDIHAICVSIGDPETTGSYDGSVEVDRQATTRSIFKDDRRMNEAIAVLSTSRTTVARCKSEPQWTESELLEAQKEHAQMLAYRTLAIPSGSGLLNYSARIPLLTQKWSVRGFNLNVVMKPDNNTVAAEKSAFSEEKIGWAFFHAGVASGLSISRDAKGIDTSWILYNKPTPDLSNRHAGFLLALGLNGHLKSVAKWVAFRYLTPKHTMTSIGLLLGLAASYIGTMDSLVTRLLSVHVTRMLPPGAAELNLSPLTQTTGIMGIGLLYCNTQHRRMSEIMVSEIEHIDLETEEEPLRNEGYRLAAGFALGLINLGKGSDLKGLHDMRLTERLLALAAGSKKVDLFHVYDKATAAAVVAIALIFMKSENQVLARKIDVPESILQFDYIRPDIFLLRTLARHLIMWSQIQPSFEWIRSNIPEVYRKRSSLEDVTNLTSEDLPFYDIIAGLCFSIALRYAGSASTIVRDLLIHYLDQLMRICRLEANTFDKKLTRNTVRNCQDLIALAVATVMAGTGDVVVFRRLRSMHGRDDSETPYGSHLAAHLAVGALFLGGGTFTFGTSNMAIAALLVAFYPIFPSSIQDNKSHLQAFRHFWVMAAEPRCLVARDIDTNQLVTIPVFITLRNGVETQRHTPCLLPELDQIKTVRTNSPEYWNLVLDLENNEKHIAAFKSTQTIYVRRCPAHEAGTSPFHATLQALNDVDFTPSQSLEWLFELPSFASLTKAERALVLPADHGGAGDVHAGTDETVVDARLVLENASLDSGKRDRLLGLRLLFEFADQAASEGKDMLWIRREVVDRLKAKVWVMATEE
ncbi:related to bimE protein [Rhynchosporium secalis]|uniref:Related to bimE protein n=1 Tax=Rhynchosporium secalis TaxID=38038 RepID=A0A1E1M0F7_RHYSE|nr:related to bimE protein [Rhynchosporium secalis]